MNVYDHNHDMPGMAGMSLQSAAMHGSGTTGRKSYTHMTFFWGKNSEILFPGWPGTRGGMYALSLVFVFVLAILVEWLYHLKLIKPGTGKFVAGLVQTLVHFLWFGLANLLMLAVMSFNGGIFLVAMAGRMVGFLQFGSRFFKRGQEPTNLKSSDLPPTRCC